MALRTSLRAFQLANEVYANATVSAYNVDSSGARLGTLATLYDAPTGGSTVANPFTLDADGKVTNPIYHAVPLILSVVGVHVPAHDTGMIGLDPYWRGDYLAGQVYYAGNIIRDGATKRLYVAESDFTATTLSADITALRLNLMLDTAAVSATTITRHTDTGDGGTTAFVMPVTPANTASVIVSINGEISTAWTLSTATITFNAAPANAAALVFHIITTLGSEGGGGGGSSVGTWCGIATGTANARVLTPSPAITSLTIGQRLDFINGSAAVTGAATLTVSALSAVDWLRSDGSPLQDGDVPASAMTAVVYDGTALRLDFPIDSVPAASASTAGVAAIATQAETNTGDDDAKIVTPLKARLRRLSYLAKSSNYTVTTADHGRVIEVTGTTTVAFEPAATLGNGFECRVENVGVGVVTLNPDGTETIDGETTQTLPVRFGASIRCNGTVFRASDFPTEILWDRQVAPSAVASIDFTDLPAGVDIYAKIVGAIANTHTGFGVRLSFNNGSAYAAGGSDYASFLVTSGASGDAPTSSSTGNLFVLAGAGTTYLLSAEAEIDLGSSTQKPRIVRGHSLYQDTVPIRKFLVSSGEYEGSAARANALRFISSQNLTTDFSIALYARRQV